MFTSRVVQLTPTQRDRGVPEEGAGKGGWYAKGASEGERVREREGAMGKTGDTASVLMKFKA